MPLVTFAILEVAKQRFSNKMMIGIERSNNKKKHMCEETPSFQNAHNTQTRGMRGKTKQQGIIN